MAVAAPTALINILNCTSRKFIELEEVLVSFFRNECCITYYNTNKHNTNLYIKANTTLSTLDQLEPEEQIMIATNVTQQLIQITEPQNKSLLPNDLGASARVLTAVADVL